MRQRKKEIEQLEKLLEQPADSVEELASDIWELVDNLRRGREVYVVGVNYVGVGQFLFGPYESDTLAAKDIEGRGNIRALRAGDYGKVFKVLAPTSIFPDNTQETLDLR